MIIVHENKEILTHNARRFLVVCSFIPESYTLKASVSMPTYLLKRKNPNQFANQLSNSQFGNQLSNSNQMSTLYSVSRVEATPIDNLFANESNIDQSNEIRLYKRPTIINRIQRHPGTLQEQFYKQKQQYLNSYLLNNRLNNSELNNEIIFERLPKNTRDSRILLSNQPQHSNVYNTQRERQSKFLFYHYE